MSLVLSFFIRLHQWPIAVSPILSLAAQWWSYSGSRATTTITVTQLRPKNDPFSSAPLPSLLIEIHVNYMYHQSAFCQIYIEYYISLYRSLTDAKTRTAHQTHGEQTDGSSESCLGNTESVLVSLCTLHTINIFFSIAEVAVVLGNLIPSVEMIQTESFIYADLYLHSY